MLSFQAIKPFWNNQIFSKLKAHSLAHAVKHSPETSKKTTRSSTDLAVDWLWAIVRQTTSFLTAATLIYALGAGITAGAGTRLVLQWLLVNFFNFISFQLETLKRESPLLFIVAASGNPHWAICAPAAFLGSSSRF